MMCKTGCGAEASFPAPLCGTCVEAWAVSPEGRRVDFTAEDNSVTPSTHETRSLSAVSDFCTRVRAERLNGGRHGNE